MLLAFDIGNTHVVFGVYKNEKLQTNYRLQSDSNRTVDEYALEVLALLNSSDITPKDISRIIVCSVVPALTRVFSKLATKYFRREALVVGPNTRTDLEILLDEPRSIGADRIVNAVAARRLYGAPVVVVDMGTATTFDIVGADGRYEGGMISPGLIISAQALFSRAAMLPNIELKQPDVLIGKNTKDAMLSGIVYGYVGLVDGILARIRQTMGENTRIVATGGLATLIAAESQFISHVVPELTLTGLKIIDELNRA